MKTNNKVGNVNNKKNVTNDCTKEMSKRLAHLVKAGEALGNELIGLLAEHGCTLEGLAIETYALTKALAALEAIAEAKNIEYKDLMRTLKPLFKEEARKVLKEEGLIKD